MAYVGNNLTVQQYAPQIAYFNGDGSTVAFTLPIAVVSGAQIIVAIENVIQNPSSSYSVSGTTLTFTSAPPSGTNNIWVEYTSLQTNTVAPSAGTVGQAQMSSPTGTGFPVLQTSPTLVTPIISTGAGSATFPSATGTVMVSGNQPAFSASITATQTTTSTVVTKIQFSTENFDTNNCYDPTTNYRFTPNVAGYYQINLGLYNSGGTQTNMFIYKNGAGIQGNAEIASGSFPSCSSVVYMNGTTDYLEGWAGSYGGAGAFQPGGFSYFNGILVRAA